MAVDATGNAITYNGTSWSVPTATPIDRYNAGLTAVSCPTTSFCAAVDSSGNALTYDGKSWTSPLNIDPTDKAGTRLDLVPQQLVLSGRQPRRRRHRLRQWLLGRPHPDFLGAATWN